MSFPYKESVIGFSLTVYLFETYLNIRQHGKLLEEERPEKIKTFIEEDVFTKARLYGLDKSYFRFASGVWATLQNFVFLYFDLMPLLWNYSGKLLFTYTGLGAEYEISQSIVYFAVFYLINTVIDLPFSLYKDFVLEEKHGFNKSTLGLFFTDLVKSSVLTLLLGSPILAGFLYVVKWAGANFAVFLWSFMAIVQLTMIIIFPSFIQPLFNKFSPLEDGPLKTQIEALAESVGFPLTKLYVIDGSKRSSHSNAYFFGLFKNKRIVLFDTLLDDSTHEEILAILGHELGHWKLNHTTTRLIVTQIHLITLFVVFQQFITNKALYEAFGFVDGSMPVLIGFGLFQYLYSPIEAVVSFLINALSRKHEFEADAFAVKLGKAHPLATGLLKLQKKNLGDMNPDSLYSAYHFTHPPLIERLNAIPAILTKEDVEATKTVPSKKED